MALLAGETIGAPIALLIPNLNHADWLGKEIAPFTNPRPGHADLTGALKYGFHDLRPVLERASARETAARVGSGCHLQNPAKPVPLRVEGYVSAIGTVNADLDAIPLEDTLASG